MNETNNVRAKLLISCPDQPGIVAKISNLLYQHNANIVSSDQYSTDPSSGMFFMRIEFDMPGIEEREQQIGQEIEALGLNIDYTLSLAKRKKRMAIFVSKEDHCLVELLWQWKSGDLDVDIPMIVSNHPDSAALAEQFGIPYYHIQVDKDNKKLAEEQQLKLLDGKVDYVVLARYMQILTPNFVAAYRNRIINIHHSFLPAFIGAKPYERAFARGVKIIGATAHFVNEQLDEGPIIEQDIQRVTHNENANELKKIGRMIERVVLARAVKWYIEDRIIIHENKTVVFN
ncbi:formyltetrahydrofolate deformylase [Paenibacillus sp. YYML68]|uniref:formyltetrahydrofolate deformylase n=1 Tax=Paenibacillus sp. YYML68 TaxID=2909250 RepID=UPI0037C7DF14